MSITATIIRMYNEDGECVEGGGLAERQQSSGSGLGQHIEWTMKWKYEEKVKSCNDTVTHAYMLL